MWSVVGQIKGEGVEGNLGWNEVGGMLCWRLGDILSANAKDWAELYKWHVFVFRNLSVTRIYLKLFSDFLFRPSHLIKEECIELYPIKLRMMKHGGTQPK